MKLIVDEYLNQGGKLVVGLRASLDKPFLYTLTRGEAECLRDALAAALQLSDDTEEGSARK